MTNKAPEQEPLVFVVDDEDSVRTALGRLFRSVGLQTAMFSSTSEFLQKTLPDAPSCLILDIRLPGQSGLDFQAKLANANINIPIIFMTAHGDIPMTVQAMKGGAIDFLAKPFRDQDMLDAVAVALERDRKRREREKAVAALKAKYETLTPRERELLALVATGLLNKQIAAQMGLAEITVKIHRGHVMRKMDARSAFDLVKLAEMLGVGKKEI
jgi:FixJ family two-component response regulator